MTWEEFEGAIWNEFNPFHSVKKSKDKLRRLVQRTSVSEYISEFKNIFLMIPGVNEGEQLDRFCQGLKPHIRLEELKTGARSMYGPARIPMNVDSAMFGAGMLSFQVQGHPYFGSRSYGPIATPIEIGNVEWQRNRFESSSDRRKDLWNNACFTCHRERCRAWKHNEKTPRNNRRGGDWKNPANVNNVDIEESCCQSARNTSRETSRSAAKK